MGALLIWHAFEAAIAHSMNDAVRSIQRDQRRASVVCCPEEWAVPFEWELPPVLPVERLRERVERRLPGGVAIERRLPCEVDHLEPHRSLGCGGHRNDLPLGRMVAGVVVSL